MEFGARLLALTEGQRHAVYSHVHLPTFSGLGPPAYYGGWTLDRVTDHEVREVIEPWAHLCHDPDKVRDTSQLMWFGAPVTTNGDTP